MHLTLLNTLPHHLTLSWVEHALRSLGHDVEVVDRPGLSAEDAPAVGYRLADSRSDPADVLLALDWVAGLAALVAARERPVPLVVRLPQCGRSGDPAVTRVERAIARDSSLTLVAGPSDLETLARLGVPRPRLQVLPEAVDVRRCAADPSTGAAPGAGQPWPVVVARSDTPHELHRVLRAMAAGVPTVAADVGVLPDVVADTVTGLVVPADEVEPAARALSRDPLRCEALGMAAADRAGACFDVSAVAPRLERLLRAVQQKAPALA
jgi:hypothetical protein